MYIEPLLTRYLIVMAVAVVGRWLVRRRWNRDPEASALVHAGCGLVICLELAAAAQGAAMNSRGWGGTLEDGQQYQWASLFSWLFPIAWAFALAWLVRGALRAIDADRPAATRLSADDLRTLLPLVRIRRGWFGTQALVVRPQGVAVGWLHGHSDHDALFGDEYTAQFKTVTHFDRRADDRGTPRPTAVVEQIGSLGLGRHWRRIRLTAGDRRGTFWIPAVDYPHVREALAAVLPDDLRERERPRRSVWEILFLLTTITLVVLNVALSVLATDAGPPSRSRGVEPPAEPSTVAALRVIGRYAAWFGPMLMLVVYVITGVVAMCSRLRPPPPAVRVRRSRASGKPPFRSAVLGWAIKGIGFVYTLFVFGSPAVERYVNDTTGADSSPTRQLCFWALLTLPCVMSMHVGHRLCSRAFTPGSHPDARPPFLFLRAFDDDDRTSLQPNTWLAWFHGISPDHGRRHNRLSVFRKAQHFHPARWFRTFLGLPSDTVEELLAIGIRRVGPLVAIGRPNERSVTSGADRMYVSDANWQEVVQSYLGRSAGVILQPSLTDGVLWEIREVFRRVPRTHVLLSMVNFQGRPDEYERLCLLLSRDHGLTLPRSVPHIDRPCFVTFTDSGQATLWPVVYRPTPLWPVTGNAIDIVATLDPYLQGLEGSPRPNPAPVRKVGFVGASVSIVATIAIVVVVAVGFPSVVAWVLNSLGL